MKKWNIYLVDDHALFREGLRFLLQKMDGVSVIYEAENGVELLQGLEQYDVDLILLDIEMPVMNGIETAERALKIRPDVKIIALSMYADDNYYASMIEAGADGFLLKNSSFSEVKRAIEEVMNGKNYFSLEILQAILNRLNRPKEQKEAQELTERENEVLFHICQGLSNAQIAEELGISKRTVDKHRENLLQKTQSKNTANLVIYAIKQGYFSI
ncbi:response regulator transcription factor [Sunxiuqinia elliptica]|uniref:LuxR family two component transcriptional regulator n=1 Tax=Sunxiuqinia elliptica TaxID=655355 RepID=A0A4R6HB26_9BACT|nr:response regulator transcription factor [Sunxiuqinia elliptica]TDO05580.1 LuxR family two component transcriptional regulator [Sunxiuqinia elliptica]TDO65124.1 LuxR family two component transcriptional regulator [Sunxiuqinia elliptica]